jgi:hypothetical protein
MKPNKDYHFRSAPAQGIHFRKAILKRKTELRFGPLSSGPSVSSRFRDRRASLLRHANLPVWFGT